MIIWYKAVKVLRGHILYLIQYSRFLFFLSARYLATKLPVWRVERGGRDILWREKRQLRVIFSFLDEPEPRSVMELQLARNTGLASLWCFHRDRQLVDRSIGTPQQISWEERRQKDSIRPSQQLSRIASTPSTPVKRFSLKKRPKAKKTLEVFLSTLLVETL